MNTQPFAVLLVAVLLTGCTTASDDPTPDVTPSNTSSRTVEPLPAVGERGSEEGWVGDDELPDHDIAVAADAHPHDPPPAQELEAAVTTGNQVVVGWLTADQTQRRQRLEQVAAEALINAFDDPRFTPVAHRQLGPTHVVESDQLQMITRHRLDTGDVVDLTLIPEPDTLHGWIVIAITGH